MAETPAELAASFRAGINRMNKKIDQIDQFMSDATPKYIAFRTHRIRAEKIRMNTDGTLDYLDPTAGLWSRICDGKTAAKTPWFLASFANGRQDGVMEIVRSSAWRHLTNTNEHRAMLDFVASGASMPDPAAATDTSKTVEITDGYLDALFDKQGMTLNEGNNSFYSANTAQRQFSHPCPAHPAGQAIFCRIRVEDLVAGSNKKLAEVIGTGECLQIHRAGHYLNLTL